MQQAIRNYSKLPDIKNDIPIRDSHIHVPQSSAPSISIKKNKLLLKWKNIRNWDDFFSRAYDYYLGKGMFAIILGKVVDLIIVAFVLGFGTFLIGCIDHENISKQRKLSDALVPQCLNKLHPLHVIALLIFSAYWAHQIVTLFRDIPKIWQMHMIYNELLDVSDSDLNTITWSSVVEKFLKLHSETLPSSGLSLPPRLNENDIVSRIMRKDNYLIALFNKDILNLRPPFPAPFTFGLGGKQMLTKVVEWNLSFCLLNYVFAESTDQGKEISVRREFLRDANRKKLIAGLKQRFVLMGLLNLFLAPFILIFLVVYFVFKYGQEFHKDPTQLSARSYSQLAKWKFRDFNELPHTFNSRLNQSYPKAEAYVNQFHKEYVGIIARLISFIAGSIALALTVLSVLDDDILLQFYISDGRTVLWYLGVFGVIWSAARGLVPDSRMIFEPEKQLMEVVSVIHYLPLDWRNYGLDSEYAHAEFSNLFELRIVIFLQELFSVILAPFVLMLSLPQCAPAIIDFFKEFTVHVEGIGLVCTFSVFDFRQFNETRGKLAAPHRQKVHVDMDEKMEQSVINFKSNYPQWKQREMDERETVTSDIGHDIEPDVEQHQYYPPYMNEDNNTDDDKYAPPFMYSSDNSANSQDAIELMPRRKPNSDDSTLKPASNLPFASK